MSSTSWRGQVYRALQAIDCLGHSKYEAKQAQGWQPGQPVHGLYSYGYKNLVFDRAITFTNWLRDQYPHIRLFRDVDDEITAEYLNEKAETYTPDTLRTALATLKKLQEGLYTMNWIKADIVPADWPIEGRNPPRGPYAPMEAQAISRWVNDRSAEYGQALRFILSSGARINEALQLRADKVFLVDDQVELLGKGGRIQKILVLHTEVLHELDLSERFVYLPTERGWRWKDGLERYVRQGCDRLGIQRRGVHGFRATAACEFVDLKCASGYNETEARRELAVWLGHNQHRTGVTQAGMSKHRPAAS